MTLTQEDINSPLWRKLTEEMESRIKSLRGENDLPLSEIDTAKLRGRIAEAKRFIDMGKPRPQIEID